MPSKLIECNPMLKNPVLRLLELCAAHDGERRACIERIAAESWDASWTQAPSTVLDALVRAGYLSEDVVVDGASYEGTLEDACHDESVSDDAVVDVLMRTSDEVSVLIDEYAPASTISALMHRRPAYAPVFRAALDVCSTSGGASRAKLESAIDMAVKEHGITGAGGIKVYPQYFIDALEDAGGIEWEGVWRATNAGAGVLRL